MIARATAVTFALLVGVASPPAGAQSRQRVVEIFGNDRCPEGRGDEIVVCARKPESDRYRIPEQFREPTAADRVSQEERVTEMLYVGRTGTQSCSPVGPGGFTGCHEQLARAWREDKRARARARTQEVPD